MAAAGEAERAHDEIEQEIPRNVRARAHEYAHADAVTVDETLPFHKLYEYDVRDLVRYQNPEDEIFLWSEAPVERLIEHGLVRRRRDAREQRFGQQPRDMGTDVVQFPKSASDRVVLHQAKAYGGGRRVGMGDLGGWWIMVSCRRARRSGVLWSPSGATVALLDAQRQYNEDAGFEAFTSMQLDLRNPSDLELQIIRAVAAAQVETAETRAQNLPDLFDYQTTAADDMRAALRQHGRAQMQMACGTGKTRVAQAIVCEFNDCDIWRFDVVVMFAPTRALTQQNAERWRYRRANGHEQLVQIVDSDSAHGATRDLQRIRNRYETYEQKSDGFVICSTFDSADVVLQFLQWLPRSARVCVIVDEFHNLERVHRTDRTSPMFRVLFRGRDADEVVFMSATPRAVGEGRDASDVCEFEQMYEQDRSDASEEEERESADEEEDEGESAEEEEEGESEEEEQTSTPAAAAAADDGRRRPLFERAHFGPCPVRMTVGDAIARGLITDLRVCVPVIREPASDVARQSSHVDDQAMFHAQAMTWHGLVKGIVYAKNQTQAREYADAIGRLIGGVGRVAVLTSETPADERTRILRRFDENDTFVVVSVRILDEGIDVPACDHVYMLSQVNRVRTIQRICRAVRKDPARPCKVATLLLWADELNETVQLAASLKSHGAGGFDRWNVCSMDEDASPTALALPRDAVEVQALRVTVEGVRIVRTAEQYVDEYLEFMRVNGKEPKRSKDNKHENSLAVWIGNVRGRQYSILDDLRHRLEINGVRTTITRVKRQSLHRTETEWVNDVVRFITTFGREPKRGQDIEEDSLALWLSKTRLGRRTIENVNKKRLSDHGVEFERKKCTSEQLIQAVIDFLNLQKREPKQQKSNPEEKSLALFLTSVRSGTRKITPEQQALLVDAGVCITPMVRERRSEKQWVDDYLIYLVNHEGEHPKQASSDENERSLARFVSKVRDGRKTLAADDCQRLEAAGVTITKKRRSADENFNLYVLFKRNEKREPRRNADNEHERSLARWRSTMSDELHARLEADGIDFQYRFRTAEESGEAVLLYIDTHKKLPPSRSHDDNEKQLYKWICRLREKNSRIVISDALRARLEAAGVRTRANNQS